MPHALTAARATVAREHEAEYLATLRHLAGRLRARGGRLWVFRHPALPDNFLEFSESAAPERLRSQAPRDRHEAALEARLRSLAAYSEDAWVLWEEIPLEEP